MVPLPPEPPLLTAAERKCRAAACAGPAPRWAGLQQQQGVSQSLSLHQPAVAVIKKRLFMLLYGREALNHYKVFILQPSKTDLNL